MSGQDERWRRPDRLPWSGEPAGDPDILEQGSDRPSGRPPSGRLSAVRWRRPPRAGIILGVAGLIVGLAAGYAAGTLHAGRQAAPSARPAAHSPAPISDVLISGVQGPFSLQCSATGRLLQLDMPTAHGTVTMIFPPAGLKLTCPR